MLDQSNNLNYYFFGCAVISDLCLFQKIVFVNFCFKISKNLMLSLIDKLTTTIQILVLVIINLTLVMSLWCSIDKESFSLFMCGTLRNLQMLLRYLSEIVTPTFKDGTSGCGGHGG